MTPEQLAAACCGLGLPTAPDEALQVVLTDQATDQVPLVFRGDTKVTAEPTTAELSDESPPSGGGISLTEQVSAELRPCESAPRTAAPPLRHTGQFPARGIVALGLVLVVTFGFVLGSLASKGWAAWQHSETKSQAATGGVLTLGTDSTFTTSANGLTAGTSVKDTEYLEVHNDGDVATGAVSLTGTGAVTGGVSTSWTGFDGGGSLTTLDTTELDHMSSVALQVTMHTALLNWPTDRTTARLASKSGEWQMGAYSESFGFHYSLLPSFEWTDPTGRVCTGVLSLGSGSIGVGTYYGVTTYTWYRATVVPSGSSSTVTFELSLDGIYWITGNQQTANCSGVANTSSPVVIDGSIIPELNAFTLAYDGSVKAGIGPSIIPNSSSFTGLAGETWSSTATQEPAGVVTAATAALDTQISVCTAGWAYNSGNPTCANWSVVSADWVPLSSLTTAVPLASTLTAGGRLGVRLELRGGLAEAAAVDSGIGVDDIQGVSVSVTWQLDAVARDGCESCV